MQKVCKCILYINMDALHFQKRGQNMTLLQLVGLLVVHHSVLWKCTAATKNKCVSALSICQLFQTHLFLGLLLCIKKHCVLFCECGHLSNVLGWWVYANRHKGHLSDQTEISQQRLDGLLWKFVETFMVSWQCILMTWVSSFFPLTPEWGSHLRMWEKCLDILDGLPWNLVWFPREEFVLTFHLTPSRVKISIVQYLD